MDTTKQINPAHLFKLSIWYHWLGLNFFVISLCTLPRYPSQNKEIIIARIPIMLVSLSAFLDCPSVKLKITIPVVMIKPQKYWLLVWWPLKRQRKDTIKIEMILEDFMIACTGNDTKASAWLAMKTEPKLQDPIISSDLRSIGVGLLNLFFLLTNIAKSQEKKFWKREVAKPKVNFS